MMENIHSVERYFLYRSCGRRLRTHERMTIDAVLIRQGPLHCRLAMFLNPKEKPRQRAGADQRTRFLEQIPKILVVYVVVILHLRRFHEGAEQPWATIC